MNNLFDFIKVNNAELIQLCFTDIINRRQSVVYEIGQFKFPEILEIELLEDSEYKKTLLQPDYHSYYLNPFSTRITISIFCSRIEKSSYCPRLLAMTAQELLYNELILLNQSTASVSFSLKTEFTLFDRTNKPDFSTKFYNNNCFYKLDGKEDKLLDIRSEILKTLSMIGVPSKYHTTNYYSNSSGAIDYGYDSLVEIADGMEKSISAIKNVALSYGKEATFMPYIHQNISYNGLTIRQSFNKEFSKQIHVLEHYIAGIIEFIGLITAFTNPTVNSYKRLNSMKDTACLRYIESKDYDYIEMVFPDCMVNPYLCLSAILMAGLYGIKNTIVKSTISDKIPLKLPKSLPEALSALYKNRNILEPIFSCELIDQYIDSKQKEIAMINSVVNSIEFQLYY